MRIFIQSPNTDRSDQPAVHACLVLRDSNVVSARPGGIIDGCAVVLVSSIETTEALEALEKAGIHALADSQGTRGFEDPPRLSMRP